MPSIVKDVSAILVAKTTFLAPLGVFSNIFACCSEGRFAKIGQIINSGILDPNL